MILDFGFGISEKSAIINLPSIGPGLYRRVLVSVRINGTVPWAWVYVVGDRWMESFRDLTGGIWR